MQVGQRTTEALECTDTSKTQAEMGFFLSLSPSQGKDKSQLKGTSSGSDPVLRPEDNAGGSPLKPGLLSTVLRCP